MNQQAIEVDAPIQLGEPSEVGQGAEVRCVEIEQRNWSRVAVGVLGDQTQVFVKQFFDARGQWQPDHWRYELEGARLAKQVLGDYVRIPALRFISEDQLVLAFEYLELVPFDVIVRGPEQAVTPLLAEALEAMAKGLRDLATPPAEVAAKLTVKERRYGHPPTTVNFKGMDIRNVGLGPDETGAASRIVVFDFGRPYLAPIEEAAAKLFVSVGFLNWGQPLSRHLKGPDPDHLALAAKALKPFLEREAIRAELALQRRFRLREFQGSPLRAILKRTGAYTIGSRYMRHLERLCENLT